MAFLAGGLPPAAVVSVRQRALSLLILRSRGTSAGGGRLAAGGSSLRGKKGAGAAGGAPSEGLRRRFGRRGVAGSRGRFPEAGCAGGLPWRV